MQEDLEYRSIALSIKAAKLTEQTLAKAMSIVLRNINPVYLEKVDKEGLKANHPNIFAEYVSKPESHRLFKVKRVKAKVATATKRKPTTKTTTPMTTPATTAV